MTNALCTKPDAGWTNAAGSAVTTDAHDTPFLETDPDMPSSIPPQPPDALDRRTDPLAPDSPGAARLGDLDADVDAAAESLAARAPVARCADGNGTMTGLFFSDHVADIARAKAMCGLCPLRVECLAGALEREEPWGVWGGELLSGGRIIANKRPCGRPPKNPRPEIVYDEMGPVGLDLTA